MKNIDSDAAVLWQTKISNIQQDVSFKRLKSKREIFAAYLGGRRVLNLSKVMAIVFRWLNEVSYGE